ncbi:MAG: type I-U CRISPR-associated protein Csb2 [Methylococcaceae bacterium]|nr:type I-U CRISPR-associated protein Csb2 [Methylococcaceae bacterium]
MQTLSISIEFLIGAAYLSDPYNSMQAEWPPAPARLYAALIAAANEFHLGEAVLQAVRTLEGTAPSMTVPDADRYPTHSPMVPNAHSPSYPFIPTEYSAQIAHEIVPYGQLVYHWPVPGDAVQGIMTAVGHLYRLGRGESLVIGSILPADAAPAPNWIPDSRGDQSVRVSQPGRYETLERDFQAGRATALPDLHTRYRKLDLEPPGPWPAPWGELLALRVGAPVDMRHTAWLADALRRAVLAALGDDAHPQVHGHERQMHVAWAALPNVAHPHADGRLIGVGVWLPKDIDAEAEHQLRKVLLDVREISCGGRRIPVGVPRSHQAALAYGTWARPATVWATATPVVLDYKAGDADRSRAVKTALIRSGYPKPAQVIHSAVCSLIGGVRAGEIRARRSANPRIHALVEFAEPVSGPVLCGAERYFCLGLFRPIG